MDEDDLQKKPDDIVLGADLSLLSIDELQHRISLLEAEIERIKAAVSDKTQSKSDAESFFKS